MQAISLIQPWASALFLRLPDGSRLKAIETRSWKLRDTTPFPLRVAVHASKNVPRFARDFWKTEHALGRLPEKLPLGCIIGFITILGMRRTEDLYTQISAIERLYGNYAQGRWGWMTSDTDPLPDDKIIPCKGALGIWKIPKEVLRLHGLR